MTDGTRSKGHRQREVGAAGMLPASRAGADPVDLLDAGASRQLVQAAGGRARRARGDDDGPDFQTNAAGQMIIKVRSADHPCCAVGTAFTWPPTER
jgi:hypothetical protein